MIELVDLENDLDKIEPNLVDLENDKIGRPLK